jgi:hypothetical protein
MRRALVVLGLALTIAAAPSSATAEPEVDFTCVPAPSSCLGWYRGPVTIKWTWLPTESTIEAGCNSNDPVTVDTVRTVRFCKVVDPNDGISDQVEVPLKVDMTPPAVTGASPSRPADANGWYRSPVQVSFTGTDATSGLLGCSSASYGGPDGQATVRGTCTDRAGNVSVPGAFGLRYDATPPSLDTVHAGAGDHVVRLRWAIADAATVEVWRSPGRRGAEESLLDQASAGRVEDKRVRNGRRYDYRLRAVDEAGNAATRVYTVIPGPRLLAPAHRARVGSPPMLRWTKVRRANYYNVQLFHEGRKVLSAWPRRPRLQLERSWRFRGHKIRLEPGRYRWLVWPGRGPRSRNDYGPLIGRRTFTVAP